MKSRRDNKETYKNKKFLVVSPAAPSAANGNKRDSLNFNSQIEIENSDLIFIPMR